MNMNTEPARVHSLDIELSDGSKIVLAILQNGNLSIQHYRAASRGVRMWSLHGHAIVDAESTHEWARTLYEASRAYLAEQHEPLPPAA
jgi:hypothetical protein